MTLLSMRDDIVETLGDGALGDLSVKVRAHAGRMDSKEELLRIAMSAPCVLIACLGFPRNTLQSGQPRAGARWGAYVITRGAVDEKRDAAALAIVEVLLANIMGNRWGVAGAGNPDGLRAENLYSAKIDNQGVAMWAVTWTQDIDLSPLVDPETLDAFETLNSEIDMVEADEVVDAEDSIELEQDPED